MFGNCGAGPLPRGGARQGAGRKAKIDANQQREIGDWCELLSREYAWEAAIKHRIAGREKLHHAVAELDKLREPRGRSSEMISRIVTKIVGPKLDKAGRLLIGVEPKRAYRCRQEVLAKAAEKFGCSTRTANDCWKLVRRLNAKAAIVWKEICEDI